tara:strand:- start:47059 stop:47877 length:819 start_codon:yes stop_codon:yes gene_type:complete
VQRRRRPKVAPRNVFGGNIPPRPQKKSKDSVANKNVKKPSQGTLKAPLPPKIVQKEEPKKLSENEIIINKSKEDKTLIKDHEENLEIEKTQKDNLTVEDKLSEDNKIIEENILGRKSKKKSIGLQKKVEHEIEEEVVLPSSKAMELIEKSRIRATEKTQIKVTDKKPKTVTEVVRKPRPRSRQKTYQPATRLKRLDRSKHMEYKYEMRALLVEINVMEEYRSNLLASIWAKGERKSTKEAKGYIDEKLLEGILDEKQHKSLSRVIENYTTRR